MVTKNKNTKNIPSSHKFESFIAHIGLTAMSVAAVTGLVEMYEARAQKLMPVLQPAYAQISEPTDSGTGRDSGHTFIRREKDEIRHMSVSYGTSMRSHPTAGTI